MSQIGIEGGLGNSKLVTDDLHPLSRVLSWSPMERRERRIELQGREATVTPQELVFAGACPFRGCDQEERHSHERFDELGWDLSDPHWWARQWAPTPEGVD